MGFLPVNVVGIDNRNTFCNKGKPIIKQYWSGYDSAESVHPSIRNMNLPNVID